LVLADGDLTRMALAYWSGDAWTPLPCSSAGHQLRCSLAHLSLFEVMIARPSTGPQDFDLPNGHFFRQSNGFKGAGELGFAVTDDAAAAFWTEFQRYGGLGRVGYPVTGRFVSGGFQTQSFQKLVLQWHPESGQALPVNILDNLTDATNGWLETHRQVPRPTAPAADEQDLGWDGLVARRQALLDPYPALRDAYFADADPLEAYGLPEAVQSYGLLITVRLQRAILYLWTQDTPWADAGSVVVGFPGELAKEAGLWSTQATTPLLPQVAPGSADAAEP